MSEINTPALEAAIEMAVRQHHGQRDKAGRPYILHPLRVMAKMSTDDERIVAVLHDVAEDTDMGLVQLQTWLRGFKVSDEGIQALDFLTHECGVDYVSYIQTVATNRIARKVKLADLEDNMDVTRLKLLTDQDCDRLTKYMEAWRFLKGIA